MKTLEISNVQVYLVKEPKGKLRALARIVLEDQLQLTGLRVYDGAKGLFVIYPNDPSYKGEDYRQIFHPVTGDLRAAIEKAILDEYAIALKEDI